MYKYGYGVDIGGTMVKMGLFTVEGELLEKWSIPTDISDGGVNVVPDIAKSINANMERHTFNKDEVAGIGMGVPGIVSPDGVITCVNLGWKDHPAIARMRDYTGLNVRCENDANLAALGEVWQGAGKGKKDVVMITLGTGVGGGLVFDGKVRSGIHGSAGELGHITVNTRETRLCKCGNRGCLEFYASANGNVRLAKDILAETDMETPLRSVEELNSKILWDYAIEGDPVAVDISEKFCNYLGLGLATIANIVDPEEIIIGGGVSRTGEPLRSKIEKYYRSYAFHAVKNIDIAIATLGNDAGIYGCVKLLLD